MCAWLADLDQSGVAIETENFAAGWGDVAGRPSGSAENVDCGVADGFDTSEPVGNLGAELRLCRFGWTGENQVDVDAVLLRDAGNTCAGSVFVLGEGDGADEAKIDDVAGEFGIVAVAESGEDLGLGEHQC